MTSVPVGRCGSAGGVAPRFAARQGDVPPQFSNFPAVVGGREGGKCVAGLPHSHSPGQSEEARRKESTFLFPPASAGAKYIDRELNSCSTIQQAGYSQGNQTVIEKYVL